MADYDDEVFENNLEHQGIQIQSFYRTKGIEINKKKVPFVKEFFDAVIWTKGLKEKGQCDLICFLGPLKGEAPLSVHDIQNQLKELISIFIYLINRQVNEEMSLLRGNYFEIEDYDRKFYLSMNAQCLVDGDIEEKFKSIRNQPYKHEEVTSHVEDSEGGKIPDKLALFIPIWSDKTLTTLHLSKAIN